MIVFINLLLYPNMIMMSTNYILINELFGNDKLEISMVGFNLYLNLGDIC